MYANIVLPLTFTFYSPPFTHFFLECNGYVKTDKKPYLAKAYQKLMEEIWGRRRYVTLYRFEGMFVKIYFLTTDTSECIGMHIWIDIGFPVLTLIK